MLAFNKPRGPALGDQIMARSVAYAVFCLFLLVAPRALTAKSDGGKHDAWSYDESATGPAKWHEKFDDCAEDSQSPIDILTKDLDVNDELDHIEFDNYDDDLDDAVMENNGHTVVVKPGAKDPTLTITEGGMDDTYKLIEIHFHWGSDSKQGSEHAIDGKKYPMEMHLVHMNDKYASKEEALAKEDGLAVLGVLFKIDNDDNDDYDPIIDKLHEIKKENDKVELDDLNVDKLLPDDRFPYYRYEGSLTTPPCSEVVTWTIFQDFVEISEKQLQKFRDLTEAEEGEEKPDMLVNNYRPLQKLKKRVVDLAAGSSRNIALSASMTLGLAALVAALTFFRRV